MTDEDSTHRRATDEGANDNAPPADYLETAAEVRDLAQRTKDSTTKAVLLKMASVWEKLASRGNGQSH